MKRNWEMDELIEHEVLPIDFGVERRTTYKALKQSLNAEVFISKLKLAIKEGLERLNSGLPQNLNVRITDKGNGWITVSPLEPQSDPTNLAQVKAEVASRWSMTVCWTS